MKIAISTTTFGKEDKAPLKILTDKGLDVALNPHGKKLEAGQILSLCKDAVGLIAGTEKLDAAILKALPSLKVISRCGVGLENVDRQAAKALGISVYNTPDAPTDAVAELTIGLMLNLLRKITNMDRCIRSGSWEKLMGSLLSGKRVGIIGFGRIGRRVAQLLTAFGCEIAFTDPATDHKMTGAKRMTLDDLLEWADIVSLHAASASEILGGRELRKMKKGAFLVNVSRGETVDEEALYELLYSKELSGAALDVFKREPYAGRLCQLDTVILTPHIGSYAKEARIAMEREAALNLLKGLEDIS